MKPEREQPPPPLTEVLTELALAQDTPDAELLDDFARRYPQYAEPLTAYAIELALEAALEATAPSPAPTDDASVIAMKAMSRFQNKLFELREQKVLPVSASAGAPANPFASLGTKELRALIVRLDVSDVFLMKLRDRRISEDTIPPAFRADLARELSVPEPVLMAHFSAPAEVQRSVSFKAKEKPQVAAKETFAEAVSNSALTAEQQAALKKK